MRSAPYNQSSFVLPEGASFPKGKLQSFLPYFLYFTKSRKKVAAGRRKDLSLFVRSRHFCVLIRGLQNLESPLEKVLILFVRSRHCGELNRGLQNLDSPFGKGFNFVRVKLLFGWADSRFAKPRCSLQRERFYSFCVVQKEPKSTPEVCEPLDSGDDSKLCRK